MTSDFRAVNGNGPDILAILDYIDSDKKIVVHEAFLFGGNGIYAAGPIRSIPRGYGPKSWP